MSSVSNKKSNQPYMHTKEVDCGHSVDHLPTMEDMARRQSMRKKRKLKRGATGICVIASG